MSTSPARRLPVRFALAVRSAQADHDDLGAGRRGLPNTGTVNVTGSATDNTSVTRCWWRSRTRTAALGGILDSGVGEDVPGLASLGNWWRQHLLVDELPIADGRRPVRSASAVDRGSARPTRTPPCWWRRTATRLRRRSHPSGRSTPVNSSLGLFVVPYCIKVSNAVDSSRTRHARCSSPSETSSTAVQLRARDRRAAGRLLAADLTSAGDARQSRRKLRNWSFQFPIYDHPHQYRIVACPWTRSTRSIRPA